MKKQKTQTFVTASNDFLDGYTGEVEFYSSSGEPRGVAKMVSNSGRELNIRPASRWQRIIFALKTWPRRRL